MNLRFLIYALLDPRSAAVRYIGKSATGMRRPNMHRKPSVLVKDFTHKANWIRALQKDGLTYDVDVLEVVGERKLLDDAERYWIAEARKNGWQITNHTDGGDGLSGAVFSAEHRARISAANKGRKLTEEQRARCLAANKARDPSTRVTAAACASNRGRKHSAEAKAKIGAAHRGKVVSAEIRAKVAAANGKKVRELATGRVYPSARAAADALNLEYSGIAKVAAGKCRLKSHHGYRFEYLS